MAMGALVGCPRSGLSGGSASQLRATDKDVTVSPILHGRLMGFGVTASRVQQAFELPDSRLPLSALVDINLATGKVRETPLTVKEGHEPLLARDDLLMCISDGGERTLFLDPDTHEIIHTLNRGTQFEYSGHARIIDNHAYITKRRRDDGSYAGLLEVVDLDTFETRRTVPTHGLLAHEIVHLEDRNELAISHYGFSRGHYIHEPFYWNVSEPAVTILDADSLELKRKFIHEEPLALTHMRRGTDGLLYVVAAQFVRNNEEGLAHLRSLPGCDDLEPSAVEQRRGRVGVPGPIAVVDPDEGFVENIMPEPKNHRKQQSVAGHAAGYIFATFTYCNRIMRLSTQGGSRDVRYIDSKDLGLDLPCGLSEIPGTDYLAISGAYDGVSIIDVHTLQAVARHETEMYYNIHLQYV